MPKYDDINIVLERLLIAGMKGVRSDRFLLDGYSESYVANIYSYIFSEHPEFIKIIPRVKGGYNIKAIIVRGQEASVREFLEEGGFKETERDEMPVKSIVVYGDVVGSNIGIDQRLDHLSIAPTTPLVTKYDTPPINPIPKGDMGMGVISSIIKLWRENKIMELIIAGLITVITGFAVAYLIKRFIG